MTKHCDFVGFTFNGHHSSEFNLYRVSDGNYYDDDWGLEEEDSTIDVPGGDGKYYYGSRKKEREKKFKIAFDNVKERDIDRIKKWLNCKGLKSLTLDEKPDIIYNVKVSKKFEPKFMCFEENGERVYKGTGDLDLVMYEPFGRLKKIGSIDNFLENSIGEEVGKSIHLDGDYVYQSFLSFVPPEGASIAKLTKYTSDWDREPYIFNIYKERYLKDSDIMNFSITGENIFDKNKIIEINKPLSDMSKEGTCFSFLYPMPICLPAESAMRGSTSKSLSFSRLYDTIKFSIYKNNTLPNFILKGCTLRPTIDDEEEDIIINEIKYKYAFSTDSLIEGKTLIETLKTIAANPDGSYCQTIYPTGEKIKEFGGWDANGNIIEETVSTKNFNKIIVETWGIQYLYIECFYSEYVDDTYDKEDILNNLEIKIEDGLNLNDYDYMDYKSFVRPMIFKDGYIYSGNQKITNTEDEFDRFSDKFEIYFPVIPNQKNTINLHFYEISTNRTLEGNLILNFYSSNNSLTDWCFNSSAFKKAQYEEQNYDNYYVNSILKIPPAIAQSEQDSPNKLYLIDNLGDRETGIYLQDYVPATGQHSFYVYKINHSTDFFESPDLKKLTILKGETSTNNNYILNSELNLLLKGAENQEIKHPCIYNLEGDMLILEPGSYLMITDSDEVTNFKYNIYKI